MRSRVAVFLGLFSAMVVMAVGCIEPEWGGPSSGPSHWTGSGTGGAAGTGGSGGSGAGIPIDGLKECSEYCTKVYEELCNKGIPAAVCIDDYCIEDRTFGGPECEDEFDAYYACANAWAKAFPPGAMECERPPECNPLYGKFDTCWQEHGYFPAHGCWDNPAPNGGTGCFCRAQYQSREMNSLCWIEGTTQICDCTIDGVSAGTCEEVPEQQCDNPRLYERCCNQYFMIPL